MPPTSKTRVESKPASSPPSSTRTLSARSVRRISNVAAGVHDSGAGVAHRAECILHVAGGQVYAAAGLLDHGHGEPEFHGDLGRIKGSLLIPLDELRERVQEIPAEKPIVAVCQSGKRSAMATQILLNAGRSEVANVPGGLIHWSRLALPGLSPGDTWQI